MHANASYKYTYRQRCALKESIYHIFIHNGHLRLQRHLKGDLNWLMHTYSMHFNKLTNVKQKCINIEINTTITPKYKHDKWSSMAPYTKTTSHAPLSAPLGIALAY